MKICVYGMHHQGPVAAACLAEQKIRTIAVDDDPAVINGLSAGKAPLFEPGLDELITSGLKAGSLSFSSNVAEAVGDADLLWIAFDTPVDDQDRADVDFVKQRIRRCFPVLKDGAIVLVTAQLPIGSMRELEAAFSSEHRAREVHFASAPENLRLGKALETFRRADRLVVGVRDEQARRALEPLLSRFTANLIWVSIESAEMSKHATNAFLAASVTLANEIATLCERTGADAVEVERALRAEPRIGKSAYVRAGSAFAGGTLARDVVYLQRIATDYACSVPLLDSVLVSNDHHRLWAGRQLEKRLAPLEGKTVGILGLAYKPGTSSLRRSAAVELCRNLRLHGALVRAFDPKVLTLPDDLAGCLVLAGSAADAATGAHALVIATEWPEFREIDAATIASRMTGNLVLDSGRFLESLLGAESRLNYVTVGRPL